MRIALMAFAIVSLVVAALAPLLAIWANGAAWVPLAGVAILTAHALCCIRSLFQQRHKIWRLALSDRHVVALDVGRRQRTIAWGAIECVSIDDDGFTLLARGLDDGLVEMRVSSSFDAYVALSHRLVRLAERRRIAIIVDGLPIERLPIESLIGPSRVGHTDEAT